MIKYFFFMILLLHNVELSSLDTGFDRINERSIAFRLRIEAFNNQIDILKDEMQDKTNYLLSFLDKAI